MTPDPARLELLVARLTPLARAQRGRLIRAQEWNDIVNTLLEVTRVVYGVPGEEKGVPAHTHLDQVTDDWLAETLRQRIESGAQPLADRLESLDRRIRLLADDAGTSGETLRDLRGRIGEVETRDLALGKDVGSLRKTVDLVRAEQTDVSDLRISLGRIENQVGAAVALGERLVINGQPVDMQEIDKRIATVEELRESLRAPSGALLTASAIEVRFVAADNRYATKDELSEVAARQAAGLTEAEKAALEGRVRAATLAEVAVQVSASETRLRAAAEAALADIDTRIDRRIADASAGLRDAILAAAADDADRRVKSAVDGALAGVNLRIDDLDRALRKQIDDRIEGVLAAVKSTASATVQAELPKLLAPVQEELAKVSGSVATLQDQLGGAVKQLDVLSAKIDKVAATDAEARAALDRSLREEMDRRDSMVAAQLRKEILDRSGPGRGRGGGD